MNIIQLVYPFFFWHTLALFPILLAIMNRVSMNILVGVYVAMELIAFQDRMYTFTFAR